MSKVQPEDPPGKLVKFGQKSSEVVSTYIAENALGQEVVLEALAKNILTKAGLVENTEEKDVGKLFTGAKIKADVKLNTMVTNLKPEGADKQLADIVAQCNANISLKLGVPEFELQGVEIESFNSTTPGEGAKSAVVMRDARLQDALSNASVEFNKHAGQVKDSYIAVIAGQARGGLQLIDFNENKETNSLATKEAAKQACFDLVKEYAERLNGLQPKEDEKEKDFLKRLNKTTREFEQKLFNNLAKQKINLGDNKILEGKSLNKAMANARDYTMMNTNHDHRHVATIEKSVGGENAFAIAVIGDPLSETLKKEFKAIKAGAAKGGGNKDAENIPEWFKKMTLLEQKMIVKNIDNYISGKCVISSQARGMPGVVNYYGETHGNIGKDNKINGIKVLSRGTWASRPPALNVIKYITSPKYRKERRQSLISSEEQLRLSKESVNHIANSTDGKVNLENVASMGLFTTKEEQTMHKNANAAANDNKRVSYKQGGLNLKGLFTRSTRLQRIASRIHATQNGNDDLTHINCMSSKDRTALAILAAMAKVRTLENLERGYKEERDLVTQAEKSLAAVEAKLKNAKTPQATQTINEAKESLAIAKLNLDSKKKGVEKAAKDIEAEWKTIEAVNKKQAKNPGYNLSDKESKIIEKYATSEKQEAQPLDSNIKDKLAAAIESLKQLRHTEQEYFNAGKASNHHDSITSRQGGSAGAWGLKLADSFKSIIGLGVAKSAEKEFKGNKMSKFNKVKAKETKEENEGKEDRGTVVKGSDGKGAYSELKNSAEMRQRLSTSEELLVVPAFILKKKVEKGKGGQGPTR